MTAGAPSPLVTVIVPTKNRRALLRQTIDSVQGQSLRALELIIVDDGSDDGTAEEVRARASADARVRYLPRQGARAGANLCRNQGLAAASADLIVFLDSDDLLDADCLKWRVEVMGRNPDLDFIVSGNEAFVESKGDLGSRTGTDILGDDLLSFLFFETPWLVTGPTWRKPALERLGGFDESLPSWQDIDLHIRAILAGLRYLRYGRKDFHVRWQEHPEKTSTLQRQSPEHLRAAERLLLKFEDGVRRGPGMTWSRQRALCSLYFFVAERWADAGHGSEAQRCWRLIVQRRLGSEALWIAGFALLGVRGIGALGRRASERIGHKWKGWTRMRTNPEIVRA